MKKTFTCIIATLLAIALSAQEYEPFTLEYKIQSKERTVDAYKRLSEYLMLISQSGEYCYAIRPIISQNLRYDNIGICEYNNKRYNISLTFFLVLDCRDNSCTVSINKVAVNAERKGALYLFCNPIPMDIKSVKNKRLRKLYYTAKETALLVIENEIIPDLKEVLSSVSVDEIIVHEE